MKLTQLARKPQLIKIELDDQETVENYGEAVEFYIYDRYPMDAYLELMQVDDNNVGNLTKVIQNMLLDEDGKPLESDAIIPMDLMPKIINKTVDHLGNLTPQTSMK